MKILSVTANNRKHVFEVHTRRGAFLSFLLPRVTPHPHRPTG